MFSIKIPLQFHFTWLIILLFFSGCRDAKDVDEMDQNLIYTNYEMTYDSESDLTVVKANFRHLNAVGRQLKLTGGSNVRFNNELLPEVNELLTNATYYEKEYAGLVLQGTFTWTDADGKVYNNTIEMQTAEVPTDLNEISVTTDYEFFWTGDHLNHDERMQLRFDVLGGSAKTYNQNNAFSESITIPVSDMENLAPGSAQLSLERRFRPGLTERTTSGGRITAEYKSPVKSVDLIE